MPPVPPVTWQDVATKDHLRVLGLEVRGELTLLRAEMERGFARQTRWVVGVLTAWSSVLLAAIAIGS